MGKVYLQSMIMVSVSLSLASWNGAVPQTSMYRMTPRDQMSANDVGEKLVGEGGFYFRSILGGGGPARED